MKKLFQKATDFNADISKWKTSHATNMAEMFTSAKSFNADISKWDVSNVRDMSGMFSHATSFNADISGWVVSRVRFMQYMFSGATSFNADISRWDVSEVVTMSNMFNQAISFEHVLCGAAWVSTRASKEAMFQGSSGSIGNAPGTPKPTVKSRPDTRPTVSAPKTLLDLEHAVARCLSVSARGDCSQPDSGPIRDWDISHVTDMKKLFQKATDFNADISKWKTSHATNMAEMFTSAKSFNADISKWDVSNVRDMSGMFSHATSFNADISGWVVSRVRFMQYMFSGATSFNADISRWDVSEVVTMSNMFNQAISFEHVLCGAAWVSTRASKEAMFQGSSGSIALAACAPGSRSTTIPTTQSTPTTTRLPATAFQNPTSTYASAISAQATAFNELNATSGPANDTFNVLEVNGENTLSNANVVVVTATTIVAVLSVCFGGCS